MHTTLLLDVNLSLNNSSTIGTLIIDSRDGMNSHQLFD